MAQSHAPHERSERERIPAHTVEEGDTVFMGIHLHGSADGLPGVEYDSDLYQSGVTGEVVEVPHESVREMMADQQSVMADFAVEAPDGTVYRWHVDNGYVIGPVDSPGRPNRSDVGKFGGFHEPAE